MTPGTVGQKDSKRIAFVAANATQLVQDFSGLIETLCARGQDVTCFVAASALEAAAQIKDLGAGVTEFSLEPEGWVLSKERRNISDIHNLLTQWSPSVVIGYGGKVSVYAAIAAKRARTPSIITIVDALPAEIGNGRHTVPEVDNALPLEAYKKAFKVSTAIVCHNAEHARTVSEHAARARNVTPTLTPAAGVNLEKVINKPLPSLTDGLVFAMIAPLEHTKGVLEYCKAAQQIKKHAPQAKFILSGPPGNDPGAIPLSMLEPFFGVVDYVGFTNDADAEIEKCHVFVCPSHAESMPTFVLRAMALGRPIITTDTPGCSETVDERVNGCLFPPGSTKDLVVALESFLRRPDLIPAMARASRQKAERRFSQTDAMSKLLPLFGIST